MGDRSLRRRMERWMDRGRVCMVSSVVEIRHFLVLGCQRWQRVVLYALIRLWGLKSIGRCWIGLIFLSETFMFALVGISVFVCECECVGVSDGGTSIHVDFINTFFC